MIDQALDFLCKQVNTYLRSKLDPPPAGDAIVLLNIAQLSDNAGAAGAALQPNAYMTLVNVEEDRIGKSQEYFVRTTNGVAYKNPEMLLNLYVLFAVNLSSYPEALRRLSFIVQFFQSNYVFTPVNSPSLDPQIGKLILDLYSMTFEQLNHLWGILGGKYYPSVLYKVRQVIIDDHAIKGTGPLITEIDIHSQLNTKQ